MTTIGGDFSVFEGGNDGLRCLHHFKSFPTAMKRQKNALSEALKQEFKKDLELFEYFLVLVNNSSPIRNVELMWADDLELFDAAQRRRFNTGEALIQLQAHGAVSPERSAPSPSTHFCDLVHGLGTYEEQTCSRSDKPAKERCRATGCSHVYPCHVGLTDIAVPVICEGRYLGTLFSGQVLTDPPTPEGFARVREALVGQSHIDFEQLEEAYYRVPVVTAAQLAEMVRMMEVFARYLANTWKRLEITSEFHQIHEKEVALDRRELAERLLSSHVGTGTRDLPSLARSVGLDRFPDRILLLRLQSSARQSARAVDNDGAPDSIREIGSQLIIGRVLHLIEDRCRIWPNTLATPIAPGELCIFTCQDACDLEQEKQLLDELAQTLLRIARSNGLTSARIGVSRKYPQATELLGAYHEAASALASAQSTVNWFEDLPERRQEPTQALAKLLKALQEADAAALATSTREFLTGAAPTGGDLQSVQQGRGLLTWACEHLSREIISLGVNTESVDAARKKAVQIIMGAPGSFAMVEAFRSFVEELRLRVLHLFSRREAKIVSETQRLIRLHGPEKVTVHSLARALKLSAGHLGRVYSRTAGHTLEEYLIRQKLEMSKRLLLDPRLQVAEVADRCGFCNPAYFASVFKKYMHCTPRAYAKEPQRWDAREVAFSELTRLAL